MPEPVYLIEALDTSRHDRSSFICEEEELTQFLQKKARKEASARASTCFVLAEKINPAQILGFYTLSNASVALSAIPISIQKKLKLPNYPHAPVTLLGRIARHIGAKGTPIGKLLMASAIKRSVNASKEIGSNGILLDPKNESLRNHYTTLGFQKLANGQMFMPMGLAQDFLKQHYLAED